VPTVLREAGLRFVVYPNDHEPAHVHVIGPDWEAVVNLIDGRLREAIGSGEREARLAVRLVAKRRELLLDAWRRLHG
jgi:hypothetical protein